MHATRAASIALANNLKVSALRKLMHVTGADNAGAHDDVLGFFVHWGERDRACLIFR